VLRSMPMNFFPMKLFCVHTPNALMSLCSVSGISV